MKREIPRMTEDEIAETVIGIVQARIFTGSQCPPDMLASVFMPLALGGLEGIDWDELGNVIEDLSKAGPMAVNGYPMFFSCRLIHIKDWEVIAERVPKAHEAMMEAAGVGNKGEVVGIIFDHQFTGNDLHHCADCGRPAGDHQYSVGGMSYGPDDSMREPPVVSDPSGA